MTLFSIRSWFGKMPQLPGYIENSFQPELLKREGLEVLMAFAFRFCRMNWLADHSRADDWSAGSSAHLNFGRLYLYRAAAENPRQPDADVLEKAEAEFQLAAGNTDTEDEALAALARIDILRGDIQKAAGNLGRLEHRRTPGARSAAAGGWMFLASRPDISRALRKKSYTKARSLLLRSAVDTDDIFLAAEIDYRSGNISRAREKWQELASEGMQEAACRLLDNMEQISAYREKWPGDPRSFLQEARQSTVTQIEQAQRFVKTALVLDAQSSEAWLLLGSIYHSIWLKGWGGEEYREVWKKHARENYIKSVSLNPLEAEGRIMLGILERQSGNPAIAGSFLSAAAALDGASPDIHRRLALVMLELAQEKENLATLLAVQQSREQWQRLLEGQTRSSRNPFDVIGLCRALVLEIKEDPRRMDGNLYMLTSLLGELERNARKTLTGGKGTALRRSSQRRAPSVHPDDLLVLAGELLESGLHNLFFHLQNSFAQLLNPYPRIWALRAEYMADKDARTAARMYLKAVSMAGNFNTAAPDTPLLEFNVRHRNSLRLAHGAFGNDIPLWLSRCAVLLHQSGEIKEAEELLRETLRHNPPDNLLVRTLVDLLVSGNQTEQALNVYWQVLSDSPGTFSLLEDAVLFARDIGRYDSADSFLRQARELNPDNPDVLNLSGTQALENGWDSESEKTDPQALEKAISYYRKAVQLSPENNVFLGNLGDSLRQAGEWDEAEDILGTIASSAPLQGEEKAFAVNSLARLEDERSYADEGSAESLQFWESAGKYYKSAVNLAPENAGFRHDYAWWLYRELRLDAALRQYQRAAELEPENSDLLFDQAVCLREMGSENAALEVLERALELDNTDEMLAYKADLLSDTGNAEEAEELYKRILVRCKNAAWVWKRLAEMRERHARRFLNENDIPQLDEQGRLLHGFSFSAPGRTPHSDFWYGKSLEAWKNADASAQDEELSEHRHLQARIGAVLLALGEHADARAYLEKALHGGCRDAELFYSLGRLEMDSLRNESFQTALNYLQTAVELAPRNERYYEHLGYVYCLQKDWNKAFNAFSKAYRIQPEQPHAAAYAGIAAFLVNRTSDALKCLKQALNTREEAVWRNVLGMAYLAEGSPRLAFEAFQAACLADPENMLYPANLMLAQESLRMPEGPVQ